MGCAFEWFGSIASVLFILQLARKVFPWIYQNFIGPKILGSNLQLKKYGEWALVTGASDGIGKAYALQLAKAGLNVVLVSRTLSKLESVAKEIEANYKVETKVIDVDFKNGKEISAKVEKGIEGLQIGVLVNNVGISYNCPEYFLSIPNADQLMIDLINCNIHSVLNMTKIVLPKMVERGTGVIINISSLSAVTPTPLISVYAATKAFVDKFSDDLYTEYKNRGIIVQSVLPGPVATNMTKMKRSTWMAPTPNIYVASALKTLGIARVTTGYYPHAILMLASDVLDFISPTLARKISLLIITNIRKRALKYIQKNSGSKEN